MLFETERLVVRQLEADDLDALYAICGDAELMRYSGNGEPLSREDTRRWINVSRTNYQVKGYGCSAVIDKTSGEFIGYCGLVYAPGSTQVELIYALKKAYWGQGYATEVAGAMLEYGFAEYGLKNIAASIDPANAASIRVVQKLGMKFLRNTVDEDGLPVVWYRIDRA
ncbi:MAG: GNAT family N-acetyltransferase [Anaerolineae bacterium]